VVLNLVVLLLCHCMFGRHGNLLLLLLLLVLSTGRGRSGSLCGALLNLGGRPLGEGVHLPLVGLHGGVLLVLSGVNMLLSGIDVLLVLLMLLGRRGIDMLLVLMSHGSAVGVNGHSVSLVGLVLFDSNMMLLLLVLVLLVIYSMLMLLLLLGGNVHRHRLGLMVRVVNGQRIRSRMGMTLHGRGGGLGARRLDPLLGLGGVGMLALYMLGLHYVLLS